MDLPVKSYIRNPLFKAVSSAAAELDLKAYVIGGYVRDSLLGLGCKDIDIMCVGDGIALAENVARRVGYKGEIVVHRNFGTAAFRYQDLEVEFVGARRESYRSNSRNPEVQPGTLQDDLNRRDFTINALAIALHPAEYGKFVDAFKGIEDLEKGILRTPLSPDITFSDDPLRMMRAIRFAAKFDFRIEPEAFEAIKRNAARIDIVAKERIADELNKMLLGANNSMAFKLMFRSGLLQHIFPEMVALHGVENMEGKGHKDNFYHTLQVLENVSAVSDNLWLRWAAVFHDIAKPPTKRFDPVHGWTFHGHEELGARWVPRLFKKLGLPQHQSMKYVQKLVRLHLRPIALVKETISDSAIRRLIFEAGNDLEDLLELCRADITSKNEDKVKKYLNNYEKLKKKIAEIEEKDRIRNFQPPVSGEDIMHIFQMQPCFEVGVIKNAIKDAILDGEIENDRSMALQLMVRKGAELGFEPKMPLE